MTIAHFTLVVALLYSAVNPSVPLMSEQLVAAQGAMKMMTTRDTIQGYFDSLREKKGWEAYLSDDMEFTSFTSPIKHVKGRAAYLEATRRFYSMVKSVEIRSILVEGDRACVFTRYELLPPSGVVFESHVAEVFEVKDGQIKSFDIYFDSAPFPR